MKKMGIFLPQHHHTTHKPITVSKHMSYKLISLFIAPLLLIACAMPPEKQAIDPKLFTFSSIDNNDRTLHFASSGQADKQPVLFIHGTPGDWTSFSDIMQTPEMQENYYMYSIDRLGWGKSISSKHSVEPSFQPHTDSINALLKSIYNKTQQKSIIVGHSLGGSLVPMVAINSPDYVKGVVIIAGDIDPKFGNPRWYNRLANLWLIKTLLPKDLAKANDEIMPLKAELEAMNARIHEIQVPVTMLHGTDDKLVSYDNVAFGTEAFKHLGKQFNTITVDNGSHFLIWEHIPKVIEAIKLSQ